MKLQYRVIFKCWFVMIKHPYRYIDYSQLFRDRDCLLLYCIYIIIRVITAHCRNDVIQCLCEQYKSNDRKQIKSQCNLIIIT